MIRISKLYPVALLICLIAVVVGSNGIVSAANQTEITRKVLLRSLEKCYEDKYITNGEIDGTYETPEFDKVFTEAGDSNEVIKVPGARFGNSITSYNPKITCEEVFHGARGIEGLDSLFGKSAVVSQALGFNEVGKETNKTKCLKIGFSFNEGSLAGNEGSSNSVCFLVGEDDKLLYGTNSEGIISLSEHFVYEIQDDGTETNVAMGLIHTGTPGEFSYGITYQPTKSEIKSGSVMCVKNDPTQVQFESLVNCLKGEFNGKQFSTTATNQSGNNVLITVEDFKVENKDVEAESVPTGKIWKKEKNAAIRALEYYSNDVDSFDSISFSEQEKYELMLHYIQSVLNDYPNEITISVGDGCYDDIAGLGDEYGVPYNGQWCKIEGWEALKDERFNVIKNYIKDDKQALKEVSFEELLQRIKTTTADISQSSIQHPFEEEGDAEDDAEKICKKNSGALGWILCPIVVGLANVGETVYDFIEENFLQIRSDVFFSSSSGLNTAWGIFRDIANVAFIILFLIVIFSQLTGVGIDNYGIKKILPKLIVTVILINLSLIICELAADVSNILGSGLNSLFSDLATKIPVETVKPSPGGSIAAGALTGGGVALFGLLSTGFAGLAAAGLAIILAAVSIVISIISSMVFLFLILMIRNAGIIILVAIAPVAFVCYMLPNTEGLFKKWVNLFKSLLVVYPICGLLVGGGKLAGNLLASLNTWPMAVAGMIVEVLPFFLIPSILRSSLKLMGNVGARLSNTGRTLGRRGSNLVQQQVRNTDKFKNFSEYNTNRAKARRAQRVVDRLNRRSGGVPENLSERNREKLLNATKKVNERNQQRGEARAGLAVVNADVVYQEKANERVKQEAKNTVGVAAVNPDVIEQQLRNERIKTEAEMDVGVAPINPDTIRQKLQNERLKTEVEMEVGVAPASVDNLRQRARNAYNEAMADNDVQVLPVDIDLARQRRQSARDSQETKNYMDQFSGMSQSQLRDEARNAHSWLRNADGTIADGAQSRMSALLQTMEANGMDNDMARLLSNPNVDVSDMSRVTQTLASSKNAVFSAYGKRANRPVTDGNGVPRLDANNEEILNGVSFNEFMTGTGRAANNNQNIQGYLQEKGSDAIAKLDDKSLGTIEGYQNNTNRQIMSTDQLVEAASQMKGEDSLGHVNRMLENRDDIRMSGEQLANIKPSTLDALHNNTSAQAAILSASDDIARDPKMTNRLAPAARERINNIREQSNGNNPNGRQRRML